jgi:hypothetical protein
MQVLPRESRQAEVATLRVELQVERDCGRPLGHALVDKRFERDELDAGEVDNEVHIRWSSQASCRGGGEGGQATEKGRQTSGSLAAQCAEGDAVKERHSAFEPLLCALQLRRVRDEDLDGLAVGRELRFELREV